MDDDLRGRELKWAYWLNTHRQETNKVARIVAFAAISIIWLIVGVKLVDYIRHYGATQRAYTSIVETSAVFDAIKPPKTLTVEKTDAVEQTTGLIDVYGVITNPNRYHVARFSYTMTIGGQPFQYSDGTLMPEETGYIVQMNISGINTVSVDLVVDDIQWQRIRGPIPKADFFTKDLQFSTTELTNAAGVDAGASADSEGDFATPEEAEEGEDSEEGGEPVTELTATILNSSPYGFKVVRVVSILKDRGDNIVGIQQTVWDDVASFESRPLSAHWRRRFAIDVQPEIIVSTDFWNDENLVTPGEE